MKKSIFCLLFFLRAVVVFAQKKQSPFFPKINPAYAKANFGSPVKIPISLAGNFGECRPNHFHSGLDVRTDQQENMDLHSIGAGYVSRVSISHTGFGNCIFVTHPGGFTSVYAHCNRFAKRIEKYIESKQYKQESWAVELQFPPHLFPIKKGTFIAKSGNTGSSHAPHLHMEIRDTKTDKTLNGLLFYPKLADDKKPIISRISVYDANKSIYHQEPKIYSATKKGNYDVPTTELINVNSDKVYFGIQANDYMENSLRLGIFRMKLIVDGVVQFGWQLNNIGYNETRYMNAIGDYKTKMGSGSWFQLCHKLPNDQLAVYIKGSKENGVVDVSDGQVHKFIIRVYDIKGNFKDVRFQVQGVAQKNGATTCQNLLKQGATNKFDNGKIAFELSPNLLYDNVCFSGTISSSEKPYSHMYHVHNTAVPVHDFFDLKLKPKQAIPQNLQTKVAVMYSPEEDMKDAEGQAATFKNGWVIASVRKFGNYEIVIDNTPPAIIPYFKNGEKVSKGSRLSFGAEDEISELKEVRMEVDGNWLRCSRRKNNYTYLVDEHFPTGQHTVTIKAVDGNGNVAVKKITLTR